MRKTNLIQTAVTTAILTTLLPATGEGGTTKWGVREKGPDTGLQSSPATFAHEARTIRLAQASKLEATTTFNIPAQPLSASLKQVADQAGIQILFEERVVSGISAPSIKANQSTIETLQALLKDTDLEFTSQDQTIAVREKSKTTSLASATAGPLRLAQTEDTAGAQGTSSSDEDKNDSLQAATANKSQKEELEAVSQSEGEVESRNVDEIVVTGSRLTRKAAEGAQAVRAYGKEEIERSGQTTVVGFLNALPSVSVARPEGLINSSAAQATVSLRGLPVGTTLMLINGQRIETSGTLSHQGAFDLNNIPIAAVERVEVLASGTSIYGSDAIAGAINIILKKNYEGLHLSARYGGADGTDESGASLAWGNRWSRGGLSVIGTYQARSELRATERELTSTNDYTKFGGSNSNLPLCHPGNVFFPNGFSFNGGAPVPFAAVPPGLSGSPTIADFAATAGTLNTCGLITSAFTLIPETRRAGVLISGEYDLGHSVSLFSDLLYSRAEQRNMATGSPQIGFPFEDLIVPATNPYNPFGTDVAIAYAFPASDRIADANTDFGRALLGAKGGFSDDWAWELSYIHSQDWTDNPNTNYNQNPAAIQAALNSSNPATALNPFIDGSPGSPELLGTLFSGALFKHEGRRQAFNGLVRGPILNLPAGALELAFGSEYAREMNHGESVVGDPSSMSRRTDHRETTAVFAEARVPLLAARERAGDVLALTLAARYDDYSDFGNTTNPQFAAEWRPLDSLLVRGTYVESFRAPTLRVLNDAVKTSPRNRVTDRTTGQSVSVPVQVGGNAGLQPEVGQSETFGLVYRSKMIPDLQVSITHWKVEQDDAIQFLTPQAIVDDEASFPGRVIRNAAGAIESIDARTLNFGGIDVAGLDYDLSYQRATSLGSWSGAVSATQIHDYDIQLVPGAPSRSNVSKADSSGNWAPRWKGAATVGWARGPYSISFTGRYVSSYQDYNSTREIGNFWLYNTHLRYGLERRSESAMLKGAYLELGAVNLFDSLPQWSTYSPFYGIDDSQADIRGRYLYLQVGTHL